LSSDREKGKKVLSWLFLNDKNKFNGIEILEAQIVKIKNGRGA
jgi:hypothetical protein